MPAEMDIRQRSTELITPTLSSFIPSGTCSTRCCLLVRAAHVEHGHDRDELAIEYIDEAWKVWQEGVASGECDPPDFADETYFLLCRGAFLLGCKRWAEARDSFVTAGEKASPATGQHLRAQANIFQAIAEAGEGQCMPALEHTADAMLSLQRLYSGAPCPDAGIALHNHSVLLSRVGHIADAVQESVSARQVLSAALGPSHAFVSVADHTVSVIRAMQQTSGPAVIPEFKPELVMPMPHVEKPKKKPKPKKTDKSVRPFYSMGSTWLWPFFASHLATRFELRLQKAGSDTDSGLQALSDVTQIVLRVVEYGSNNSSNGEIVPVIEALACSTLFQPNDDTLLRLVRTVLHDAFQCVIDEARQMERANVPSSPAYQAKVYDQPALKKAEQALHCFSTIGASDYIGATIRETLMECLKNGLEEDCARLNRELTEGSRALTDDFMGLLRRLRRDIYNCLTVSLPKHFNSSLCDADVMLEMALYVAEQVATPGSLAMAAAHSGSDCLSWLFRAFEVHFAESQGLERLMDLANRILRRAQNELSPDSKMRLKQLMGLLHTHKVHGFLLTAEPARLSLAQLLSGRVHDVTALLLGHALSVGEDRRTTDLCLVVPERIAVTRLSIAHSALLLHMMELSSRLQSGLFVLNPGTGARLAEIADGLFERGTEPDALEILTHAFTSSGKLLLSTGFSDCLLSDPAPTYEDIQRLVGAAGLGPLTCACADPEAQLRLLEPLHISPEFALKYAPPEQVEIPHLCLRLSPFTVTRIVRGNERIICSIGMAARFISENHQSAVEPE